MKRRFISDSINKIWIDREQVDYQWKQHSSSFKIIMLVGPSRSGKYSCAEKWLKQGNTFRIENNDPSINIIERLKSDSHSHTGIILNFMYYQYIQNPFEFFFNLQNDTLIKLQNILFGKQNVSLINEIKKNPFSTLTSKYFFNLLSNLLDTKTHRYAGMVVIYLCGIHYVAPKILNYLLRDLRSFLDYSYGNPIYEPFRVVLTSLEDGYHLTKEDSWSPLNSVGRIEMKDFSENEFKSFLDRVRKEDGLAVENPKHLFSITNGDVYSTKVILSYCQRNLTASISDLDKKTKRIKNNLVDEAVEFILTRPPQEYRPFQILSQYLDTNEEVRDVLNKLNFDSPYVPLSDFSGVFTLPESSGAVLKREKDGNFVYVFRNEIYKRFIERYFDKEKAYTEAFVFGQSERPDMSFPAMLTSAIHHEMSGPIGVISAEIDRITRAQQLDSSQLDEIKRIKDSLSRLSALTTFLDGLWVEGTNEPIDFNLYLKKITSIFIPHLANRGIKLKYIFDKNVKFLSTYSGALRIAIVNLIMNARDSIIEKDDKKGIIAIETQSMDGKVKLLIRDNGIGMSESLISKVTNYGFSTKEKRRGIGLTLCKTAVRKMQAELLISSEEEKGTEVTLIFRRNLE